MFKSCSNHVKAREGKKTKTSTVLVAAKAGGAGLRWVGMYQRHGRYSDQLKVGGRPRNEILIAYTASIITSLYDTKFTFHRIRHQVGTNMYEGQAV